MSQPIGIASQSSKSKGEDYLAFQGLTVLSLNFLETSKQSRMASFMESSWYAAPGPTEDEEDKEDWDEEYDEDEDEEDWDEDEDEDEEDWDEDEDEDEEDWDEDEDEEYDEDEEE
ncbi:MAG: hypothetical protein HY912_05015 [Desulfomonile tiedjei]|uniref:Uncharacterized protein n=1 Tax=Desulfomonile tiedjei TaxID=2358 RepID=A0A9D6Z2K0_9BACT|nr:hypothetical protein [Desulfomonile tiedjei]